MRYIDFEHKKALRFGARISLRSYMVINAIKKGLGIRVKHKEKIMSLSNEDLKIKSYHNPQAKFIAQFDGEGIKKGQSYYLIDYTFVPDGEVRRIDKQVAQLRLI